MKASRNSYSSAFVNYKGCLALYVNEHLKADNLYVFKDVSGKRAADDLRKCGRYIYRNRNGELVFPKGTKIHFVSNKLLLDVIKDKSKTYHYTLRWSCKEVSEIIFDRKAGSDS